MRRPPVSTRTDTLFSDTTRFRSALQASRTADLEKAALLNVAANESARKLVAGLAADRSALRLVVNTLAENPNRTDLCQRADEILRNRGDTVEFVVYQRGREQPLCASVTALSLGLPAAQRFRTEPATILPDRKEIGRASGRERGCHTVRSRWRP